jgi:hypothetical protein
VTSSGPLMLKKEMALRETWLKKVEIQNA